MAIIYMIGTEESVKSDAYINGPTPNRMQLINNIKELDVLVGKRQDFQRSIVECKIMRNGKLENYSIDEEN